jgi:DNA-directed RNA polymerase subunit RPC12/RpoP
MTAALLTRTLDEELEALIRRESDECLVCGEEVERVGERVECPSCGAVLERRREPGPDQLALL